MGSLTIADLLQTTLATCAFALFFLPPGYLLAQLSNIFGMRRRSISEQLLFSIVLSFAATPILTVLLTRGTSYTVTLSVFVLCACGAALLFMRRLRHMEASIFPLRRSTWYFLASLLVLFVLVQASLVDLQYGHRLYLSYTAYDRSVRVPLIEASARTGVPPLNPFYAIGNIPPLRYFYYWYVVCALPVRLLGISAKACLNASVFWSGFGVISAIPLFLKYVLNECEHLRKKSLIGIALLAVTGLDLIPYMVLSVPPHAVARADIEWWDPNQVTSWMGSLLWVPHHVASLVACMAGFLLFSQITEENPLGQRIWLAILSALAFASAAGLSVYVTFTFAIFVLSWTLITLAKGNIRTVLTYIFIGALTLLLSWPYLLDLFHQDTPSSPVTAGATRFAYIALREGPGVIDPFVNMPLHSHALMELLKVPALLITYFLEFGFFAVVLIISLRRDLASANPLPRQRRMLWTMCGVCLFAMTFLRSDSASGVNDLGFRGVLVIQFALLVMAAPILERFSREDAQYPSRFRTSLARLLLLFTLILGVAGTTYQLLALRVYAPLADAGHKTRDENFLGASGFGERTYWLVEGFARLDKLTLPTARVQYDPSREEAKIANLYSTRQAAMGDPSCISGFGGDLQTCQHAFPSFFRVFNGTEVRMQNLDAFCDQYKLDILVANDIDPVWNDRESWVWTRPTLVANPYFRAIPCGTHSSSQIVP